MTISERIAALASELEAEGDPQALIAASALLILAGAIAAGAPWDREFLDGALAHGRRYLDARPWEAPS